MSGVARRDALDGGGRRGAGPGEVRIRRVAGAMLEEAAHRLVEHSSPGDGDAGRRFVAAARSQGVDLGCFFAAVADDGEVLESALAVPGAGRAAMFFASHPDTESRQAALSAAIGRACDALGGMVLAQALLLPKEARAARAFGDAGFDVLADLGYLRWRPGRPGGGGSRTSPAEAWAAGVGAERFRADGVTLQRVSSLDGSARDRVLREALRQSYEGTLDCPALCRMRTVDDVLSSHRAVGVFDPSLWWVIESEGRPSGALLWSRTEGGGVSSAELVYMGLSPRLRGKGLGGKLLAFSREELTARGIAELTCAVDLANTPARNLYDRFGFRRWAVRRAFVRRLAG